ncbi:MAG: hypothetical protein GF320_11375 [Armatimonadia bacterium]|nr:hypothetical protein [Armatimonadia bacterium]
MIAIIGSHPAAASLRSVGEVLTKAGEAVEFWDETRPEPGMVPMLADEDAALEGVAGYYEWWRDHCCAGGQVNPIGPWAPEGMPSTEVARRWIAHWMRKVERHRPRVVVTWGSVHLPSRAALRALGRLHGREGETRGVCIEEGLFPAREGRSLMIDAGASYYEGWAIERAIMDFRAAGGSLGGAERKARLDEYASWWRGNRRTKHEAHVGDAELPDKWYWSYSNLVVFGQVPWDAAVWAADPAGHAWGRMVQEARREREVWFKPHPRWPHNPTGLPSLPADASIHRLLPRMRGGAAVSSGVIYELALAEVPVAAYGQIKCPSSRGLVWSLEDLDTWEDSWLQGARWDLLGWLIHEYQATTADPGRLVARIHGEW